jgi:hypothetical protein
MFRIHRQKMAVKHERLVIPFASTALHLGQLIVRSVLGNHTDTGALALRNRQGEATMPVLLWFLGVPISLIVVLMLFGAL